MTALDERAEAPLTLDQPAVRSLRLVDQLGLWANLGVSLLGFTGALFVIAPVDAPMSLLAALTAVVVGTVIGTAGVSAVAAPGADTGAPAMVLLRGLFGARASWLPTALNILQLLGWTTFELVTIGAALHQLTPSVPKWVYVLAGGVITTVLALWPLGWIRTLRRYVTVIVAIALVWFFVQVLRHPLPSWTKGGWHDFWLGVDTVVAVSVSWVPVAADYTRHARSPRQAAVGSFVGYSITQILCYALGLFTLVTVARGDADHIFGSFLAVPLGGLAFAVLAVRELDQSFVDTFSTAVSVQNLRPHWDRRTLALAVGSVATVAALALDIGAYVNFLTLLGSVFTPLLGVFVVDWYVLSRRRWDLGADTGTRWGNLLAWVAGFVVYQAVNPGVMVPWSSWWHDLDDAVGFTPASWMSASILSCAVAALVTLALGATRRSAAVEGEAVAGEADGDAVGLR
ncbi:MAG: purine-cytosine permease family protein [Jatrophihabitans sp.]|uniref:purine-cytosine permease family protein n=1 Tax=Jatrophihabitans sp. TaxID=1932789 RepID=UPI003F7F3EB5